MKRSVIVIGVGIYLILGGLVYLLSPSPDVEGPGILDPFTVITSGLLLLIGVGLLLHKRWAALLYWALAAAIPILLMILSYLRGISISYWLPQVFVISLAMGVPAFLLWLRRDRLSVTALEAIDAQA